MIMRKSTYLIGVSSSVLFFIGAIFKILHWPLAGIFLTLSVLLFALGYALLLLGDKNKIAQNSYQKFVNWMTFAAMVIVSVSFLFKAQHWPGAGLLIYAAHAVLVVMIPVLFIQGSKESDPVRKLNINNIAVILTFITAVSLFIWLRTMSIHP
ncbi:MAG: hypothetical protein QG576_685 [Bacteroidota bacterium]|nr:hypothetical protein [Bacteroidota bacterium]